MRQRGFYYRVDADFNAVVAGCAAPRSYGAGTWITREMAAAYARLNALGWAHSFESWRDRTLVGGLYGVAVGRVFFGESMFTRVTDASKVALVHAVEFLAAQGIELIDCQIASAHTTSLGAAEIPRAEFLARLAELCRPPLFPQHWRAS